LTSPLCHSYKLQLYSRVDRGTTYSESVDKLLQHSQALFVTHDKKDVKREK